MVAMTISKTIGLQPIVLMAENPSFRHCERSEAICQSLGVPPSRSLRALSPKRLHYVLAVREGGTPRIRRGGVPPPPAMK